MPFQRLDLTGQRFGRLVVMDINTEMPPKRSTTYWNCMCDCGNTTIATTAHLRAGSKKSCGCLKINDLTGRRFGRLFVEKASDEPYITKSGKRYRNTIYVCRCDCGKAVKCLGENLLKGATTSCGCYQRETASARFSTHGSRQTRLYSIWANMKSRCLNPNNKSFGAYGGRDITICDEWIESFAAFQDWATKNGYAEELTIDRIDVNKGYEPDNCRWVTSDVQSNNQRKNIRVEICGETRTLKQWTTYMGWKYGKYSARHRKGKEPFLPSEIQMIKEKLLKE